MKKGIGFLKKKLENSTTVFFATEVKRSKIWYQGLFEGWMDKL